ncbi:hypothetical protein [Burkholderia gladioli]|uniref:hypothetical protein n=1 Tax=Burkholderia gladioli TaxID=28095 RepID=UPI001ABBB4CD|nr:hypothetical protein [Burkholderia gladioli]
MNDYASGLHPANSKYYEIPTFAVDANRYGSGKIFGIQPITSHQCGAVSLRQNAPVGPIFGFRKR